MCGIYTVAACREKRTEIPLEELERLAQRLVAYDPRERRAEALNRVVDSLGRTAYEFLKPHPQAAVVTNGELRDRLAKCASELEKWVRKAERFAEESSLAQAEEEALNFLIGGARDTAWRIRKDVLENAEKIRTLCGPEPVARETLIHFWHLNLVLNNLDRLEVRGRDSAGTAFYLHFPDVASCELFLQKPGIREEAGERGTGESFGDRSIIRPPRTPQALLFAYKVADEVGEMGENVRSLRRKIREDRVLQEALRIPSVRMTILAHTRWASNGVISVSNCHPVDSTVIRDGAVDTGSRGAFIACLNGDIDNFQELKAELASEGVTLPGAVTTDAKIIPVWMDRLCARGMSHEEAFRAMIERFEGSVAVALVASDRPGEIFLAQKGSGQGLFIGPAGEAAGAASELYGLVELTDRYVKAHGERKEKGRTEGECFRIRVEAGKAIAEILTDGGASSVPSERIDRAEITTRDIDRGDFPRYLLKEINESVASVRKTLRGKIASGEDRFRIRLAEETLHGEFSARLKEGKIKRIFLIGQGTAAVAAQGIAYLLERAIGSLPIEIKALKATELSGHHLRDDMRDTLVVAVSQSGTTTDTNRTVDLVRARGAYVVGIVNRRNSDLVFKSDGVLYTSDGRDIEMSVASTKAFYAQTTAGQLLALSLAQALGALPREELEREVESLLKLPSALERTLQLSPQVKELARRYALRRRYWAIVGTGPGKIAANEIRIKLSELCYKAIAVDFLEDKKHIDLSSEPLIIVCATGLEEAQTGDAVKEIAIFKAHRALPIVITEEGEERFLEYAAGCISVPRYEGSLAFLLPVMIGHLFGYHAAETFEKAAVRFRKFRRRVVETAESVAASSSDPRPEDIAKDPELVEEALALCDLLRKGKLDSALEVSTALSVADSLDFLLGRYSLDLLPEKFACPGTVANCLSVVEKTLSRAIDEMTRPIDAIKHQAKTVTVGVSRIEDVKYEGVLWDVVRELGLPPEKVPTSAGTFMSAFGALVSGVEGLTLYKVRNLTPLGQPTEATSLHVVTRRGCASVIPTRYETARALLGTKLQVVTERAPYVGFGQRDERRIVIVPFTGGGREGFLLLVHVTLEPWGEPAKRLKALRADRRRYNRLIASVTERDVPWSEDLLNLVDNDTLFLKTPEEAASAIVESVRVGATGSGMRRG